MVPQELVRNPKTFWAAWGTIAITWQIISLRKHNGATGSETTRAWLWVHTKPGKILFLTGFYAFVAWFPDHILRPAIDSLSSSSGVVSDDSK